MRTTCGARRAGPPGVVLDHQHERVVVVGVHVLDRRSCELAGERVGLGLRVGLGVDPVHRPEPAYPPDLVDAQPVEREVAEVDVEGVRVGREVERPCLVPLAIGDSLALAEQRDAPARQPVAVREWLDHHDAGARVGGEVARVLGQTAEGQHRSTGGVDRQRDERAEWRARGVDRERRERSLLSGATTVRARSAAVGVVRGVPMAAC